jgi:hypothetical protein
LSKCFLISLAEYAGFRLTLAEYAGYRITLSEVNYTVMDGFLTEENGLTVTDENGNPINIL